MARPRKWRDDVERRQEQNERRKRERKTSVTMFTGVDGEGTGRGREHRYVLLGVGSRQIENPDGLRFREIMPFLWDCFLLHPDHAYVGFFLGYDFTQWFRSLPEERARMLLTGQGRAARARRIARPGMAPFPVRYAGWEFDMLGSRRFKLRKEDAKSWMYINDAGPFFQTSFMSVIDPSKWVTPVVTIEEFDILSIGKDRRDIATLDDDMRLYNRLENEILARRVMPQLESGFRKAGVRLKRSQWFGPGQAAQKWLDNTRVPDSEKMATPKPVEDAARRAYYGGWFEIMAHGHIPGVTHEYDINSAYPHVASRLPCFLHGAWKHYPARPRFDAIRSDYVLVHARVAGMHPRVGAMLHRCPDHSIRRPHNTAGWFWKHELQAAYRAGFIETIEASEAYAFEPGCEHPPPMEELRNLYRYRLEVGKNTPEGKGARLLYNSIYGKFAQSVGNPRYNSYLVAGLITSGCRTMILDAIASHPEGGNDVVMVATDAVYFRNPHPQLVTSERLGEWEHKARDNICLFKPGVYWDDETRIRIANGSDPAFKSRGISARDFAASIREIDVSFARWEPHYPPDRDPDSSRDGWFPKVKFPVSFSMVTATQALARGKWFTAGNVKEDVKVTQDSDPVTKRHSGIYENGVYWSRPYQGWWETESTPYREDEQPDPEEWGITDDGTVRDHWFKGIHG